MRRTALKRKTPLRACRQFTGTFSREIEASNRMPFGLKRTRLKTRSPRKRQDDAKYTKAKAEHFASHPGCQHPRGCTRSILKGDKMDLHHRGGRNGPLLYYRPYFATACREDHELAKSDPKGSRANGWVVDVSSEEVRRLRQEELLEN